MPTGNFRGVSLRKELFGKAEKLVKEHPEAGYKSVADFVSEAVRLRLEHFTSNPHSPMRRHHLK